MAKYRVMQEPGFPGPRGFVRAGEVVVLPNDFTPSRTFMPLDEAAREALAKAKQTYVEDLERRMAELDPPRKLNGKVKSDLLKVPEIEKAPDPDAVEAEEDEGQTIRETAVALGEAEAQPKQTGRRRASDM